MTSGIERRRQTAQKDTTNTSYQKRRHEIFEAAGHVFKKKGFQATSLSDVAEYMGADRASLYYYVANKQELLDGAVSEPVRQNVQRIRTIAASDTCAPEKIRTLITDLMTSYHDHYPFLYVFIQENLSQIAGNSDWAKEMRGINREYQEAVVSIIEAGRAEGSIEIEGSSWVLGYGIIGLVAWTNRWYDPNHSKASASAIANTYAEMVINGISANPRTPVPDEQLSNGSDRE